MPSIIIGDEKPAGQEQKQLHAVLAEVRPPEMENPAVIQNDRCASRCRSLPCIVLVPFAITTFVLGVLLPVFLLTVWPDNSSSEVQQRFMANLAYHWDRVVDCLAAVNGENRFEVVLTRKHDNGKNDSWLIRPLPELRQADSFRNALQSHAAFPRDLENYVDESLLPADIIRYFDLHQTELSGLISGVLRQLGHQSSSTWYGGLFSQIEPEQRNEEDSIENVEKFLDYIGHRVGQPLQRGCPVYKTAQPNALAFFRDIPTCATVRILISSRGIVNNRARQPEDVSMPSVTGTLTERTAGRSHFEGGPDFRSISTTNNAAGNVQALQVRFAARLDGSDRSSVLKDEPIA